MALTVVFAVGTGLVAGDLSSKSVGLILDTHTMPVETSGEPEHGVTVTILNGRDADENLQDYPQDTLEVYVQVKRGSTSVWYRVATIPVATLIP